MKWKKKNDLTSFFIARISYQMCHEMMDNEKKGFKKKIKQKGGWGKNKNG